MNELTKSLEFDDVKHTYRVNGVELPAVSDIISPITYSKYRVDAAVINQAAHRGTVIHDWCMRYDLDSIGGKDEISPDIALYLKAWKAFCHDYSPEWEYIEMPMASHEGFAGTVDRIGLIDGKRCVVDIKTTSSMDRSSKVALACQLQAYKRLAIDNGLPDMYDGFGVQLKKDGTYTVYGEVSIMQKYNFDSNKLFTRLLEFNKIVKGDKSICLKN